MSASPRLPAASLAELATQARRRAVVRAIWIGLWAWPSFLALDAYMCFVAFPGAPFRLFVLYRVVIELALFGVYVAGRRRLGPVHWLERAADVCYGCAALTVALMAVHLGGVRSPYMHGISIVALVRATVMPQSRRRAWPIFAAIGLVFPVVMGMGVLLVPAARAAWLARDALVAFAANYVFVVASAALGMLSGHMVWRAQEQVYRARRVGRYRLQAPVGKGGMGEVWLAWDLALQRNVALKLLRVDAAAAGADAVRRFEREALAASQLRSRHIAQVFDFGASDDGLYYIAMEYLAGLDLQTLVDTHGPQPPGRAVHFLKQACVALEEAHAAGIIHRDIKPHNLFVTRMDSDRDFIKLLDFGIVRFRTLPAGDTHLTWTGAIMGTPAYVAPEVWRGAAADERSDIYSLGVTLYFLLTRAVPFEGIDPAGLAAAVPQAVGDRRGDDVPPELEDLVRRCIAWHPDDRVQSAGELWQRLADLPVGTWTAADADAFWLGAAAGPGVG